MKENKKKKGRKPVDTSKVSGGAGETIKDSEGNDVPVDVPINSGYLYNKQ